MARGAPRGSEGLEGSHLGLEGSHLRFSLFSAVNPSSAFGTFCGGDKDLALATILKRATNAAGRAGLSR